MDLRKKFSLDLLTISTLILFHSFTTITTSTKFVDTLKSFTDPKWWMYQVVVDLNDNVYAGGTNVLNHLSPDLELKETFSLGPVMDHRFCLHPSYPCSTEKVSSHNYVNALQMIYNLGPKPYLLVCGSVYRALCQIRPVDNLTEYHWVHPFNQSVGYTTSMGGNHMYFGQGYDDQQTLFTVASMENFHKDVHFVPFVASKVLEKDGDHFNFRYSFQNDTAKSAMEFSTWAERELNSGIMVHDGFLYVLVTHTPDLIGLATHDSRLVRVCIRDGTFQSYSELPIACDHPSGQFKASAYAAYLDDSPSQNGSKSIYVAFTKGNNVKTARTALCIFPMTDVIRAFSSFSRDCLPAVGHRCQKEMIQDITDFCGSDVRPFIVNKALVVPYFTIISETVVVAMVTVRYHNEMVAIVGDRIGQIQKVSLTSGKIFSSNIIFRTNSTSGIRDPLVFDRSRKHIYALRDSEIVKYPVASCRVHETCKECFTDGKIDPLNCGWCGGYCAHSEECDDPRTFSQDTCTPSIIEVSPQRGPIQGAVKIKITGDNFGSYVDGENYLVTLAGIPCEIFDWQTTQITCILGPAPEGTSGPVELNVFNSSTLGYNITGSTTGYLNFSYYAGPRLFGIYPNKGPSSGGTNISLFGENLDFENDKDRYFIVRGRLCNLKRFNATTAWCITDNETNSVYPDRIAIIVGDTLYVMDKTPPPTFNRPDLSQSFEYIPDPEIHDIQPGITTVSGLINVTVSGLYFDSVLSPQIVVEVSLPKLANLEFFEACWSDPDSRGTILTCSTPSFVNETWLPMPTRTSPLTTHVSFIMDGVQWVREFSQHQEDMSRLHYYPDPEFDTFRELKKIEFGKKSMEIKGDNLGLLQSVNSFQIRIGEKESCKIATVSTELVVCDLPPTIENSSFIGTNIPVQILMGSTRHHLGYITIIPVSQNQVIRERTLLAIYILIPFVVIVVAFLCFRQIQKKKLLPRPIHNIFFSNQNEAENDNPPMAVSASAFEKTTEPCDEMVTLNQERMFILEELGLIIQKQHLIIGEFIGSGQFGKVFKGSLKIPNQKEREIAIKTLYRHLWTNPVRADQFMNEALTMKDFNHPHVLGLLGVCFEGHVPHIVLPFMVNGDLCTYIRDETKVLLVTDLMKFAVDIASGMRYLAKLKFVHRDLAARNCILDSTMRVKVADFGLSRDIYEGNYYRSQDKKAEIPFRWTAPEVLASQISTTQSDVWSYGVLLWELMTRGIIPFANIGNWDVLPYLRLGNRLDQPQFCPKSLYLSMIACWNTDSKKRPSFFKLHSYVSEIQNRLLSDPATEGDPSFATVPVPAQNTIYYDSKKLYLKLDDHALNIADLEEVYSVKKEVEVYEDMKDEDGSPDDVFNS